MFWLHRHLANWIILGLYKLIDSFLETMYFIAASPSHAPFEDDFPIAKVDILSSIDWGWMMSTSASTSQSLTTSDQKNAKKQKPSGSCGFVFRDPGWLVSSNTCLSWISTRTPFAKVPYYSYFWGRNLHLPVHVQRFQQESSYNRATKGKKPLICLVLEIDISIQKA